MVEFALISPIFFLVTCGIIDGARAAFYYTQINAAASDAARELTLPAAHTSDCTAMKRAVNISSALTLKPDPNSLAGNADPTTSGFTFPTKPALGVGYVYFYPAQSAGPGAPLSSVPASCTAAASTTPRDQVDYPVVSATIRYNYVPWTPVFKAVIPSILMTVTSSAVPES